MQTLTSYQSPSRLTAHIAKALYEKTQHQPVFFKVDADPSTLSAVLLLLGIRRFQNGILPKPCLILNKRSRKVRQPGDLCCPGGGVSPRLDLCISKLLTLPFSPLSRWLFWQEWRKQQPQEARQMALLFATSLRESFEEMRLNPFGVKFLGMLPPYSLQFAKKAIYPMVGWMSGQSRFAPNWEVEEIVYIPLENLLNRNFYARYRIRLTPTQEDMLSPHLNNEKIRDQMANEFPCFLHQHQSKPEILWGATYRMVTGLLIQVFDFTPPDMESLPVVSKTLDENYFSGDR